MRIWIDTDPALGFREDDRPKDVDDAFVIVEALRDPDVEVAGIGTVFGNAPVDVGTRVARELVAAVGGDAAGTSVARGAAGAGSAREGFACTDAVRALAEALRAGPLAVCAIGPLTNLAGLLEHFPDEAARIERCVVVAGRSPGRAFTLHGASGIPDFNFECDPHAARALVASAVPLVCAGFELTSQVVLTRAQLAAARARSPVAERLVDGALPWLEWWTGVFPKDGGFHPWDSAALAVLRHPEWFACDERGARIGAGPDGTPWLELGAELPGRRCTYAHGFAPGGAEAFVAHVAASIR
ncbi:MAG: nucleoside hydrolase [Myxococcota bacterium]